MGCRFRGQIVYMAAVCYPLTVTELTRTLFGRRAHTDLCRSDFRTPLGEV